MFKIASVPTVSAFLLHDGVSQLPSQSIRSLVAEELAKLHSDTPLFTQEEDTNSSIKFVLNNSRFKVEPDQPPMAIDPLLEKLAAFPDQSVFPDAQKVLGSHISVTRLTFSKGLFDIEPSPLANRAQCFSDLSELEQAMRLVAHVAAILAYASPTAAVYWPLSGYVLPTDAFAELAGHENLLFLNTCPTLRSPRPRRDRKIETALDLVGSENFIGHRVRHVSLQDTPGNMTGRCMQYLAACLEQQELVLSLSDAGLAAQNEFNVVISEERIGSQKLQVALLEDKRDQMQAPANTPMSEPIPSPVFEPKPESVSAPPSNPYPNAKPSEDPMSDAFADELGYVPPSETAVGSQAARDLASGMEEKTVSEPQPQIIPEDVSDEGFEADDHAHSIEHEVEVSQNILAPASQPIRLEKADMAELRAFAQMSSKREEEPEPTLPFGADRILERLKNALPFGRKTG